jgi:hypothetical protein
MVIYKHKIRQRHRVEMTIRSAALQKIDIGDNDHAASRRHTELEHNPVIRGKMHDWCITNQQRMTQRKRCRLMGGGW